MNSMNEILKANVFFFVTTVAIIVLSILIAVALVYVIHVVRNVSKISDKVREKSEDLAGDVDKLRAQVKEHGKSAGSILRFFLGRFMGKKRKAKEADKGE